MRFVGWLPIEQIPRYIAQADIGVVPASAYWLLPNKLFEYVAMGKPVIAAESPALKAVFGEEAIAYFQPDNEVSLAQRILELHASPTKASCLARNARLAYERYTWSVMKQTYVDLHKELLSA